MIQHYKEANRLFYCLCKRCNHTWIPRIENPVVCPKCHSSYWNKDKLNNLGRPSNKEN